MRLILVILCLLYPITSWGQGLLFQRDSVADFSITTYDVFSKEKPSFERAFYINFDIEIYDYHTVGNIFRVSNLNAQEKKNNYIFAYSYCDEQNSYFKFNIETKESLIADTLPNHDLGIARWHPVSVRFDLEKDLVIVKIDDRTHTTEHLGLDRTMKPQIIFGGTNHSKKFAAFSIRNLKIGNEKQSFSFLLNEQEGTVVHDQRKRAVGKQYGGQWLINRSYHWEKKLHYRSATVAAINFDPITNHMLLLNRDSLVYYTPYNNSMSVIQLPESMPINARLGTSFYDRDQQRILVYEVNNLPLGDLTAAQLDLKTLQWTHLSHDYMLAQRHHHVSFYDKQREKYTIFGGFGNRRYMSDFQTFDDRSGRWYTEQFTGDTIYPRFATGLVRLNDEEALIHGGVGNETGDEIVGVIYYDDLYKVNFRSRTVKRLWNRSSENYSMVPARNMYITPDQQYIYALCYPIMEPRTYLKLYKISVEDGTRVQLGDSIPGASISILSNFNLYCSQNRNEMYCVAQEFVDRDQSDITIYSISTPVIAAANLKHYDNFAGWRLFVVGLVILSSVFVFIYDKRRRRESHRVDDIEIVTDSAQSSDRNAITHNAFYIFGDFQVYDRSGRDITYMFSNVVRQLLVLTVLHSYKNEDGISTTTLSDFLWPDKDVHSVKNVKGVTIYNLRQILKEIDGIEIVYEKNKYRVRITPPFYCDYYDYKEVREKLADDDLSGTLVHKLSGIVNRGKFLAGFDDEIYDESKTKFENEISTMLPIQIASAYQAHNYPLVLVLVSIFLQVDPYSELSLRYELHSLLKLKQTELAKKKYYQFKISYLKNMGEEYPLSYNVITAEAPDVILN